jgi:dTDP-4-dehydrorhamnose 3,5-epimerase
MRFRPTLIPGAVVVELEPHGDERGYFARTWSHDEFAAHGLPTGLVQASVSRNHRRGTVRGMHMQLPPSAEGKLVRCARGAIFDVVVDLRPDSPTYRRHVSVELTADAGNALFIPPLLAHGFQTLADDTDVFYQMTDVHAPALAHGFRWDDPAFGIAWPIRDDVTIAARDRDYPDFDHDAYLARLAGAGR